MRKIRERMRVARLRRKIARSNKRLEQRMEQNLKKPNKKKSRKLRNGLLILSVIVAMVVFILSAMQLTITNPYGMIALVLSGGYILTFWYQNDEV